MDRTRVVVIGGGATGTGILRDLSMRGIPALLLEKGDLASGTSSRFHGLLHSGARYAVNDPDAARECITENRILRRIGTSCVEETEGFFVRTPEDDPAFEERWLAACRDCGIDAVKISVAEALAREPSLTPDAVSVYRVPDSAVDGFRLVWHNVMSARRHGGDVRTYCRVTGIETSGGAVTGVAVRHALTGACETIPCDYVINATGSWAGEVAALAGMAVPVTPDRGTLLAFNHRFTNRVINRLRKATDGDIFVPHGSITIFGTTSIPTDRPDDTTPRTDEILQLLDMGQALFPKIHEYRILRAFAGTRPLYSPDASTGRAATRNFVILDHAAEGLKGMATITGGKFTSYRLMAEKITDLAAEYLGVTTPCRTAEESIIPMPGTDLLGRAKKMLANEGARLAIDRLGDDLERAVSVSEHDPWKKLLLCECELVTLAEFETVAAEPTSHSLGDIRRRTRLGMGTCQGSFCALRATGALVENSLLPETPPQDLFRQFLQERWQGIRPLLWGTQLKEVELERGIYAATLNLDGDMPAMAPETPQSCPAFAPVAGKGVLPQDRPASPPLPSPVSPQVSPQVSPLIPRFASAPVDAYDVIVAGAGFSGLVAAAAAAGRGKRVLVISKGAGALTIGGGGIDLLGYTGHGVVKGSPFTAFRSLPPGHPYSIIGEHAVRDALDFLATVAGGQGVSLLQAGSETAGNAWMPTAAGTMKPTWITGPSMNPCSLAAASSFVILGFAGMKDFSPQLAASGLRHWTHFTGKTLAHELAPSPFASGAGIVRDTTALDLACFLDTRQGVDWLATVLRSLRSDAEAVLLPAILGTKPDSAHDAEPGSGIHAYLERVSGRKIIELFCPPPSVTGLRMRRVLMKHLRGLDVSFIENAAIVGAKTTGNRCEALVTRPQGKEDRERTYAAASCIIATGGLFGEGLATSPGKAWEAVFGLPLFVSPDQDDWSCQDFFCGSLHPFAVMGVPVTEKLQPIGRDGKAAFENVHFAGRTLSGYDFATEKSGSGVALATGHFAGSIA